MKENVKGNGNVALFIDQIQEIEPFEITLRDLATRGNYDIYCNVKFLENLITFLAENLGRIVSFKAISEYLKSQKMNISPQVVIDYLGYLESSFLIFKVKRTGIEGKKIFEIGKKVILWGYWYS